MPHRVLPERVSIPNPHRYSTKPSAITPPSPTAGRAERSEAAHALIPDRGRNDPVCCNKVTWNFGQKPRRVASTRRVREGSRSEAAGFEPIAAKAKLSLRAARGRPGRKRSDDGDAKRRQQTEPTTPRERAATPAKRGRPPAADSMRPAPSSSTARNTRHKVPSASSPRRPHRGHEQLTAHTKCGQQTAWGRAADSERVSASPYGVGAPLRVCSGWWFGARLAPGSGRPAGRPSVWVSAR